MARKATTRTTTRGSARKPKKRARAKPPDASQAIRQLDGEFMRAAESRDAAALVRAFYASNAVLMPPNHAAVSGRTAIQEFLQGLMDGGLTRIKLETAVTASADDLAYGRGRYTLSMSPESGEPVEDVGKYIVVYRRQPNGPWRAVADIFNSDK
jgi:ketosteroid isomerase-like protein